jgi:two-component system OmpR family response regulator
LNSASFRILVIESEEPLCAQLAEALRAAGYAVDLARSGREALNRAEQTRYTHVVLDLNLPDISGILVYLMLRGIDPELCRQTLFVSAALPEPYSHQALASLGLGYLPKPFATEDLIHKLGAR